MTENQARNRAQLKDAYDYLVVGAGASGSVVADELTNTGADVLVASCLRVEARAPRRMTSCDL